jgi:hypothetical protein
LVASASVNAAWTCSDVRFVRVRNGELLDEVDDVDDVDAEAAPPDEPDPADEPDPGDDDPDEDVVAALDPALTVWPTTPVRLDTVPSEGAVMVVASTAFWAFVTVI